MITIITVCYNSANNLERTIQSVLMQKNADIEYIIKDGKSKDNTDEIIKKYRSQLDVKCKFIYVSEKDNGLYDAMNIATDMATGDRIVFLNSGDCLYDENVIFVVDNEKSDIDIIYGDTEYFDGKKRKVTIAPEPENIDVEKSGMFFNHQAAYIKTDLMKKYKYDTTYRLCADCDFFYKVAQGDITYKHINKNFVLFAVGGLSYQRAFDLLEETYNIQYKYGAISKKEYIKLKLVNKFKRTTKKLIPEKIYSRLKSVLQS